MRRTRISWRIVSRGGRIEGVDAVLTGYRFQP
jgi:hypothetical protein